MRDIVRASLVFALSAACLLTVGCAPDGPALGQPQGEDEPVTVSVVEAEKGGIERTTTQPAVVHAYYRADVYACTF